MNNNSRVVIRDFVRECLAAQGGDSALDDSESLFLSGRLDSLSVTKLVVFLETSFGVDFATRPFDVDDLDSVEKIVQFAAEYGSAAAE